MEDVNENLVKLCIQKWGKENSSERIEYFKNNYDNWIKTIPLINRNLINRLIENFVFYGKQKVNKGLSELYIILKNKYNIDNDETVYTHIKKSDSTVSSSMLYLMEFVALNSISEKNCITEIKDIKEEEWIYIKNIVLVDDYSGTGESIIKYLKDNYDIFKGKDIYILLISMSEGADVNIKNKFSDDKMNIIIESIYNEEKAFSKLNFPIEEEQIKREEFETVSNFKKIKKANIWGRNNTEALISFYNNTPNNTLGIFWEKTESNVPLFPRNDNKRPKWKELSQKKKNRKLINANNYMRDNNG